MQELPYIYGCFQLYYAWWAAYVDRRLMDNPDFDVRAALQTIPLSDIDPLINRR
jgi:hypothetical protein